MQLNKSLNEVGEHPSLVILTDMQDEWLSGITEVHVLAYDPALEQQVWCSWTFSHVCFMATPHIFIVKEFCLWWFVIFFSFIDSFLKYISYFLVLFIIQTTGFICVVWLEKWSGGLELQENRTSKQNLLCSWQKKHKYTKISSFLQIFYYF